MSLFAEKARRTSLLVAAAAASAVVGVSTAVAAPTHPTTHHHTHHAAKVRSFDTSIYKDVNHARKTRKISSYHMSTKLWKIAHAYAKQLSKTGVLVHNPNLERYVTKICPAWTDLGENIGYVSGSSPSAMFSAYMHSPEHKANILDHSYRNVGIASVQVVRNGVVEQWNVMDFANHCG